MTFQAGRLCRSSRLVPCTAGQHSDLPRRFYPCSGPAALVRVFVKGPTMTRATASSRSWAAPVLVFVHALAQDHLLCAPQRQGARAQLPRRTAARLACRQAGSATVSDQRSAAGLSFGRPACRLRLQAGLAVLTVVVHLVDPGCGRAPAWRTPALGPGRRLGVPGVLGSRQPGRHRPPQHRVAAPPHRASAVDCDPRLQPAAGTAAPGPAWQIP